MVEKDPLSAISSVNKGLGETETRLTRIQSRLRALSGLSGQVGQGFASAFSFSGNQGSSMGLGTSGASFGAGTGGGTGGSMMPWIYTKSGAVAYGTAQAAMGTAAAAYSLMPSLSIALPTRAAYYGGALLSPGMSAAGLAQRTLGALNGGVTSPTDAAAAQAMLAQGYNFNPGGSSYLRAMQEVGGAARMLNISNPQAAQAIGGLHTGSMSSRLYQLGISTLNTQTGTIRSTEDIYRQIYNRYFGGKGKITPQDIEISLREGFAGAEMRNVLGMSDTQMQMFQQAAVNFSQGKGFNLPDATGKGNPQMDIYRQQTSLAVTTETKADELLAGLTTATDAYVKMNEQLQGDGGVVSGLAKLKGVLEGIFGTNAGGALGNLAATVGTVATTAIAYKGFQALAGAKAGGAAAVSTAAKSGARIGGVKMAGAAATAGASALRTGATVGAKAVLGRAIPVVGGVIGAATGQGFLSTVAMGAIGGGITGSFVGGIGAVPGAVIGGTLAGVGWLGTKAFQSMFATSKSQQTSGNTGQMNNEQWATALLQKMGAPVTSENLSAIMTWMQREGGGGTTTGIGAAGKKTAMYNPLNTTLGAPGATAFNKVGVRNYSSWDQGLQATLDTLQGTRGAGYESIMAALKQGNSSTAVLQAIQQSSWAGKSHYGYNLASGPMVTPSGTASTTVSSGGNNVNITLTIDKASDAEAIAFAKKVKDLLLKDKALSGIGSK